MVSRKLNSYHIFLHTHFGKSSENFLTLSRYFLSKHGKLMNSVKGKFINNQYFTRLCSSLFSIKINTQLLFFKALTNI